MACRRQWLQFANALWDVCFGSLADIAAAFPNVRSTPESGHRQRRRHVRFVPKADIPARPTIWIEVRIMFSGTRDRN